RYAGTDWRINAHVPSAALRERWPMEMAAMQALDVEVHLGRITRRGATRAHRLAWTLADMRGLPQPGAAELAIALALRSAKPLDQAVVEHFWSVA
ncbi:MAG TPA: ATP-binding protein, partial [Marmoricola sp.]|nr:ATP-binding protein [Marmoricola sp.]